MLTNQFRHAKPSLLLTTHLRNLTEISTSDFPSQGGLIVSDSSNHNSIVNGARGSGATIRVLRHNNGEFHEESCKGGY
ncbi:hypothetical protein L1987_51780 [Smallanthus sonchifolius]|uniref:Uncharacterized protein n=1 Tax=Smallanthus sonchifolius TaxID=185202 RepID=A0ACB9ESF4_9ASTR|nr:hypothetical protein L1987_51780 [Smallanthus sonchifolius]